ncbi:hypothetical protein AVEN_134547-1 [Araneus ventricosus]|uniref:Uncharacterized protein n=1 Tax=Araneus ventricosus TaxID=182803 RepID=A0A4Y2U7G0_ARAVE|nr:hypothetical protein AVEN_134547-1 [Araneus ventricosus]
MIELGWMTLDLVEGVPRELLDVFFNFINFPVIWHGMISHVPWRIHHDMENFPSVCFCFMSPDLGCHALACRDGASEEDQVAFRGCCDPPPPSGQTFVAPSHNWLFN